VLERATKLTVIAALVSAAITLGVTLLPFVRFAYRSSPAHVALETAAGLIALLAAFLLALRLRRTRRESDALLVFAMTLFGLRNLVLAVLPAIATPDRIAPTWGPLAGQLLAAAALAAAAFASDRRLRDPARAGALAVAGAVAIVALVAASDALFDLPVAIDPGLSPESSGRPRVVGNGVVLAALLVSVLLFAAASVAFLRRSRRDADELMAWFAIACAVGAFARVNYFLFPSLFSEWVYTGDLLRVGFYLIVLIGAASEIASWQRDRERLAVVDERRRVARDLHDGLAQELTFIANQAHRVAMRGGSDPATARAVAAAASRALDEARAAVSALSGVADQPLDEVVAQAAQEVAGRVGVDLRLDVEADVSVPAATQVALMRVVREAIVNAERHGGAQVVSVTVRGESGLRLAIVDDGSGFDVEQVLRRPPKIDAGFGLVGMRERVESLGGRLRIASAPGQGTRIDVSLP
jgi:signal transduction histidine kinase